MNKKLKREAIILSVKGVTGIVAGVGARKVIKFAVEKVVPEALGKSDKALVVIGTIALAATIGNAVGNAVSDIIDTTIESVETVQGFVNGVTSQERNEDDIIDGEFNEVA